MTEGRLSGKVAVITGGANGMGAEIARVFAREGARVAIFDRQSGTEVVDEIVAAGGEAHFWSGDVTNEEDVERLMRETFDRFGALHILINNAGVNGPPEAPDAVAWDAWQKTFAINVGGPFLCTKHAIPYLRRTSGGRAIVNTSSIYGLIGNSDSPVYHATKGAVHIMSKTDAMVYAPEGIRVNSVHPGTILTPLALEKAAAEPGYLDAMTAKHPLGILGEPKDVALAMVYLASDEARFITGAALVIDGGYTAQ